MVYIWDVHSAQLQYKLPGHHGSVNEVVFHPKVRRAAPLPPAVGAAADVQLPAAAPAVAPPARSCLPLQ